MTTLTEGRALIAEAEKLSPDLGARMLRWYRRVEGEIRLADELIAEALRDEMLRAERAPAAGHLPFHLPGGMYQA